MIQNVFYFSSQLSFLAKSICKTKIDYSFKVNYFIKRDEQKA